MIALDNAYRKHTWEEIPKRQWDVAIIGGGITGAGIAREAARAKLSVLLIEQKDFAWGTSSRSSKMIHGGLRYLKEGKIGLTKEAANEREYLLERGAGLIDPLSFLYVVHKGDNTPLWMLEVGLTLYDLLGKHKHAHKKLDPQATLMMAPKLRQHGLKGGFQYIDAKTDDARLVFRVLKEAIQAGGFALNYVSAEGLLKDKTGNISGIAIKDQENGQSLEIQSRKVVNATGVWADNLRKWAHAIPKLRPLRGSHIILSKECLPVAQSVSFLHPKDRRPVFAFPWEGVSVIGTTDVDHEEDLNMEPYASKDEIKYLLEALENRFKDVVIHEGDIIGTFAGVRPIIGTGKKPPSKESRSHVLWDESGLLTVTGGKLTTYRVTALQTLKVLLKDKGKIPKHVKESSGIENIHEEVMEKAIKNLTCASLSYIKRLYGRLGADFTSFMAETDKKDMKPIGNTPYSWAELKWAAKKEAIVHLEDLLMRRVRLAHLMPDGGLSLKDTFKEQLHSLLGWDEDRWKAEWVRYENHYKAYYRLKN